MGSRCRLWRARSKFATVSAEDPAAAAPQMHTAPLRCALRQETSPPQGPPRTLQTSAAQHRRNAGGPVRGWSPCTPGFVQGSCGGGPRRWWFEGGLWDGAWKAMNSKRRSSGGGGPPARVSWGCLLSAGSSSVQQQRHTHPAKKPFWMVLDDPHAALRTTDFTINTSLDPGDLSCERKNSPCLC